MKRLFTQILPIKVCKVEGQRQMYLCIQMVAFMIMFLFILPHVRRCYAIIQGQVDGFEGTEEEIVYIMTRTDRIQDAGLPFVLTDGHAIMSITEFYNDLSKLTKVDWDIMREWYWNDTEEDPDRKRRRQAEFLVHNFVGIQHFIGFAVRNEKVKQIVQEILVEYEIDLPVAIRKHFYFGR